MSIETYYEIVQKLYVAYYQRPADPGGLRYWAQVIDTMEIKAAVNGFVNSPEATALYSGDITAIITAVYNSAFNRAPEPAGLQYWTNVYNNGWATLGTIVWEIVNGARNQDLITLQNKLESAMNFTKVIDPELDGIDFQVTYSGNTDAEKARQFLKDVNSDSQTVASLQDAKAYIVTTSITDSNDPLAQNPQEKSILEKAQQKSNTNTTYTTIANLNSLESKALNSQIKWYKKNITYSFLNSDPQSGYSDWKPLDSLEKNLVRDAFSKISTYVNLNFIEVSSGGDIQFGSANLPGWAGITEYFYIGKTFLSPIYIYFDNDLQYYRDDYFYENSSIYTGWGIIAIHHEIGHALGLKHPFEGTYTLPENINSIPYTVMSYNEGRIYYPYFYFDGTYVHADTYLFCTPTGLSLYDIQALQAKYGANLSTNMGDTVYNEFTTSNDPYYLTIWDAGGKDTIDFSSAKGQCIINLTDGTTSTVNYITPEEWISFWTEKLVNQGIDPQWAKNYVSDNINNLNIQGNLYTGQDNLAIVKGTIIENVKTGTGNDIIYDNVYNNVIETSQGNDRIYISKGFDIVYGGTGTDTVYLDVKQTQVEIVDLNWYNMIIGEEFAIQLIGVEKVVFSDGYIML